MWKQERILSAKTCWRMVKCRRTWVMLDTLWMLTTLPVPVGWSPWPSSTTTTNCSSRNPATTLSLPFPSTFQTSTGLTKTNRASEGKRTVISKVGWMLKTLISRIGWTSLSPPTSINSGAKSTKTFSKESMWSKSTTITKCIESLAPKVSTCQKKELWAEKTLFSTFLASSVGYLSTFLPFSIFASINYPITNGVKV